MIFQVGGEQVVAQDMAQIEEVVPFTIVFPEYLPYEMQLTSAVVSVPPLVFDEEGRKRNTRVSLMFGNDRETAWFNIDESIAVPSSGDPNVEEIMIGEVQGELVEEEERQFVVINWAGCGIGFVLMASMSLDLTKTKEEAIRIAESTLGACQ